jgi:hypothetical protein
MFGKRSPRTKYLGNTTSQPADQAPSLPRPSPYDGVVELTATPEAERIEPGPVAGRWVKPIKCYARVETTEVEGRRFG